MFQRSLIETQFPECQKVTGFAGFLEFQPALPQPGCVAVCEDPPAGAYVARCQHAEAPYMYGTYLPGRAHCRPEPWVIPGVTEAHDGHRLSIAITAVTADSVTLMLTCDDTVVHRTLHIPKAVPRRQPVYAMA